MPEQTSNATYLLSPSSRRAWIEILPAVSQAAVGEVVALLAEGVDRNNLIGDEAERIYVALLAEGVDRNTHAINLAREMSGRPPRGGRG